MCGVVCILVASCVAEKRARHSTRRISLIVVCGPAHSRQLDEQRALRHFAQPLRFGAISGPKTKISKVRIVAVGFGMVPIVFRIGEARSRFEQQHVESARRQFFGDYSPASPSANDNCVSHGEVLISPVELSGDYRGSHGIHSDHPQFLNSWKSSNRPAAS